MIIKTFITTPFEQNTRIAACAETGRAVCIDPGDSADEIATFIHIGFNTPSACCGFILYE